MQRTLERVALRCVTIRCKFARSYPRDLFQSTNLASLRWLSWCPTRRGLSPSALQYKSPCNLPLVVSFSSRQSATVSRSERITLQYTELLDGVRRHKRQLPHCVLLTRVGSFYEMYFEDALRIAPLLHLKIAHRAYKHSGRVPMAGFPVYQLERYLRLLVQERGLFVAIAEQYIRSDKGRVNLSGAGATTDTVSGDATIKATANANTTDCATVAADASVTVTAAGTDIIGKEMDMCKRPRKSGSQNEFERRIARIVSPGTVIDETFLDQSEHHYLCAVYPYNNNMSNSAPNGHLDANSHAKLGAGICWAELATGELHFALAQGDEIASLLMRIRPREILLHCKATEKIRDEIDDEISNRVSDQINYQIDDKIDDKIYNKTDDRINDLINDGPNCVIDDRHDRKINSQINAENRANDSIFPAFIGLNAAIVHKDFAQSPFKERTSWRRILEDVDNENTNDAAYKTSEDDLQVNAIDNTEQNCRFEDSGGSESDRSSSWLAMELHPAEQLAIGALFEHIASHLPDMPVRLQAPLRFCVQETLALDAQTLRGLEIVSNMQTSGVRGTLFSAIKRTVTKSGTRLLADRLLYPLALISKIEHRLDLVEHFVKHRMQRGHVQHLLRRCDDMQRIVQKFSMARADCEDMLSLANTIESHDSIVATLRDSVSAQCIMELVQRGPQLSTLARNIRKTLDEEALMLRRKMQQDEVAAAMLRAAQLNPTERDFSAYANELFVRRPLLRATSARDDGDSDLFPVWMMRRSASARLGQLHEQLDGKYEQRRALQQSLQAQNAEAKVQLRWKPGSGPFVRLQYGKARGILPDPQLGGPTILLSRTKTSQLVQMLEWTVLRNELSGLILEIRKQETRTFELLRSQIFKHLSAIRHIGRLLDELDVSCGLADLAQDNRFVRPQMDCSCVSRIERGRHPIVEHALMAQNELFEPNDCVLGARHRLWLITGPNMGGKSTFIRQNAIISILAQMGSFVPAARAQLGVVDKIFARIGSGDNLHDNESTFMVEMNETAHILKNATHRSLVVLDEVGRGTTVTDGISLAYACADHLLRFNRSRVLFATHYHELADLLEHRDSVGLHCTEIESDGTSFFFDRKLRAGVNKNSHGLFVAKLADVPEPALQTAREMFNVLSKSGKFKHQIDRFLNQTTVSTE